MVLFQACIAESGSRDGERNLDIKKRMGLDWGENCGCRDQRKPDFMPFHSI